MELKYIKCVVGYSFTKKKKNGWDSVVLNVLWTVTAVSFTCNQKKRKRNKLHRVGAPPPSPCFVSWADLRCSSPFPCSEFGLQQAVFLWVRTWKREYYCSCDSTRAQPRFMTAFILLRLEPNAASSGTFHAFFRPLARKKKHFVNEKDLLRMSPA